MARAASRAHWLLSYGTTATINTTSSKYIEVTPFIPPYPSAIPGVYSTEVQIFVATWMVNWFKQQFGHHEQNSGQTGVAPEALFDELVNSVPPGSMGLMLQPYWSPGIKIPGPEAKGAIIGLATCTPAPMSTAPSSKVWPTRCREARSACEKRSGVPITDCGISGGGSQSDAAMQLTADIFGLPTSAPACV